MMYHELIEFAKCHVPVCLYSRQMYGKEFDVDFTSEVLSKSQTMKQKLQEHGQYFGKYNACLVSTQDILFA